LISIASEGARGEFCEAKLLNIPVVNVSNRKKRIK
jgi:hypothetical protein